MNLTRRQAALLGALTLLAPAARAQAAWPSKPLRIMAGGASSVADIRARWLADRLAAALGQPVLVENNGAAGGNVGAEQVARSAPDGYTLLLVHQGTAAINPHLYAHTGYNPLTDFAPITRFGYGSLLLTVHPGLPVTSVRELIALAKAKPNSLNYGSPGNGTPPHLAAELFKRAAGIEATHVPFKGGGAMMQALLGGHVSYSLEGLTAQLPHVRAGTLRALGVTGAQRTPSLPDVPTIAEAGVPGFQITQWYGFFAPAKTPPAVVDRLNRELVAIMKDPDTQKKFADQGADVVTNTPAEFGRFVQSELGKWGKFIAEAKITAD